MSLQSATPWLIVALVASAIGIVTGGVAHHLRLVATSASLFALAVIWVSVAINAPYWRSGQTILNARDEAIAALRRNAHLVAIAYAWGAVSMQALYTTPVTGLRWQHGWQYALAMLLLAVGSHRFARALGDTGLQGKLVKLGGPLAIANALLSAAGLVFLTGSGKLLVWRSDWAANQVFLFGALILMLISAIALKTHARLMRS